MIVTAECQYAVPLTENIRLASSAKGVTRHYSLLQIQSRLRVHVVGIMFSVFALITTMHHSRCYLFLCSRSGYKSPNSPHFNKVVHYCLVVS